MYKKVQTLLFVSFLIFLILFSNNNLVAAKNGLSLWANCVVPSLFPFFIATELLSYTNVAQIIGKLLDKLMRPLFNVPGEGAYALILGIISGYPVGAKIVIDLYENGKCSKSEAERLLAFTNNSGPLFIIGTVGILLFGNSTIGALLLLTHVLSGITLGIVLGFFSRSSEGAYLQNPIMVDSSTKQKKKDIKNADDIGSILNASIKKSIFTVWQIGGFVVLFSVILSMLNSLRLFEYTGNLLSYFHVPLNYTKGFLSGFIELTNGVNILANTNAKYISINIILCAFLLGFGGISVMLQVISIISGAKLNIKTYIYGKLFQGLIAALYTSIFIQIIPCFNFDLAIAQMCPIHYLWNFTLIIATLIVAFATVAIKSKIHHKTNNKKYNLLNT